MCCYLQDWLLSLDVYKKKQEELSLGRDHLVAIFSCEDLLALDQRLCLLDRFWTELCEQISLRRTQVQGRLECWSDFDEQCRRLMEAIAKCESGVEGINDMLIEDLIVLLQTVRTGFVGCN